VLVERYASAAVNLAARLVRDRTLAEDLAQEAFIRAFGRLESFDRERKFSSWFFQVVHNVVVDHLRRRRLTTVSLDEPAGLAFPLAGASALPSPADHAEREELGRAMARALELLRPEYRECLILHYREGLTHAEVGAASGIPVGTVKTHLHRGRAELAEILAAQGWGPRSASAAKPTAPDLRRADRE